MLFNPSKSIDPDDFLAKHPLNFLLFYGDYEVINTVYLDDGSPLVDLSMELFNQSRIQEDQSSLQTVKFEKSENLPASAENHHFSLSLGGQIFELESSPEGWEVKAEDPFRKSSSKGSVFYFLKKEGCDLGSTEKIVLKLKNFKTAPEGGTRTLRAELTYGPLLKDKDGNRFEDKDNTDSFGNPIYFSYGNTIFITNNRGGKKTLPLQVGFAAGNAVLNDGTSQNSLQLLIANKNWPSTNLSLSQDSEFVISFEMDETNEKGEVITSRAGAVLTDRQAKAIGIAINTTQSNKWDVQPVPNLTEWTVKPQQGTNQLASDEAIKLNITNLVTIHSSGAGYLYVRYKNIPNYPDGQFVVPVEKTPLLYRDIEIDESKNIWHKRVGIGTTSPSAKLHVEGGDAIVIGKIGIGTTTPSAKLHVQDGDAIVSGKLAIRTTNPRIVDLAIGDNDTGLKQQGEGHLAIYTNSFEWVRIDDYGKVGIGTTAPLDKLHVDGNIRLSGNINGANQKLSIYSNTTAGNSNAWIELWGTTNGDSTRTGELSLTGKYIEFRNNSTDSSDGSVGMRLTSEGKLGIGTTTPKEKLHVVGDLVLGTDANNKKFIIHSRGSTGEFLQITSDKSDGNWNWDQGIILKRGGNVGIGTNAPSAKLDVNGSVKLGDGSTAWNRIICGKVIIDYNNISNSKVFGKGISSCSIVGVPGYQPGTTPTSGLFKITFEKSVDPEKIVVIVTPQDQHTDNIVNVQSVVNDGFTIQVKDSKERTPENSSFHFIALELTENINKLVTTY